LSSEFNNQNHDLEQSPSTLSGMALAVLFGAGGGYLFLLLSFPLPWMLGAMFANTLASLCGLRVAVSRKVRLVMIAVIGVLLGSAFSPAIAQQITDWIVSLVFLSVFLVALGFAATYFFSRVAGYDVATAYFSSMPAGLTEMTIIGSEFGGDEKIIAFSHTVRVLLVAFIVPLTMTLLLGYERPEGLGSSSTLIDPTDAVMLIICGILGAWGAGRLKLPAAALVGPLALSGLAHLIGATSSYPPLALVSAAQVVLGSSVGVRFAGVELKPMASVIVAAAVSTIMMLGLAGMFAYLAAAWTGLPLTALFLSFSPGGVTEMSLIALALNQDIAFVTTHHISRICVIVVIAPAVFSLLKRFSNRTAR